VYENALSFFFCGSVYVQVIVPGASISTVFDCLQYAVSNQKAGVCKRSKNWGCKIFDKWSKSSRCKRPRNASMFAHAGAEPQINMLHTQTIVF